MKKLTIAQARSRRRWMAVLFGLTVILLVLTPFYVILTVGGIYREMLLLPPELAAAIMIMAVFLWPLFVVTEPVCFAVTAALFFCGVVIAVELWRRQRYLEETYQLRKSE